VGLRLINRSPLDMHVYLIGLALSTLFLVCVSAQGLTSEQIDTVQQLLALGATRRSAIPRLSLSGLFLISFIASVGNLAPAPKLFLSFPHPPFLFSPPMYHSPLLHR
jgi:hypothetical protein